MNRAIHRGAAAKPTGAFPWLSGSTAARQGISMPIRYVIDEASGVVSVTAEGNVRQEEDLECFGALVSDPGYRPGMGLLLDYRNRVSVATTEQVKQFVEAAARLREAFDGSRCAIVVSEGVRNADGQFLSETGTRDSFGHAQLGGVAPMIAELIKERLGYKYHWAVADYLQRSARHIASATDVEQAYALGRAAVELAVQGQNAVMPIIVRISDDPFQWEVGTAKLEDVANVEKKMPPEYISDDGFGITEACRRYLRPLIQGEDYPPYKNGLPDYVTLRNVAVPRKLNTEFAL